MKMVTLICSRIFFFFFHEIDVLLESTIIISIKTCKIFEDIQLLELLLFARKSLIVHNWASMFVYFLAVLDFVNDEAIDDAWVVASYLSDSDVLLASVNGRMARNFEAENVVQSAAASVAVRGVLFGNSHLAPTRYRV